MKSVSLTVVALLLLSLGSCSGRTEEGTPVQEAGAGGTTGGGGSTAPGGTGGTGGATAQDAASCGVINAADYDQSCTSDSDCALVFSGDTCTADCAFCPTASINERAVADYHPVYPPMSDSRACQHSCIGIGASCFRGHCYGGTQAPPDLTDAGGDAPSCGPIGTAGFDKSCSVDSDCVAVFEGDTCDGCTCPNATINATAAASYHPVIPADGSVCACPRLGVPACNGGTCTL